MFCAKHQQLAEYLCSPVNIVQKTLTDENKHKENLLVVTKKVLVFVQTLGR